MAGSTWWQPGGVFAALVAGAILAAGGAAGCVEDTGDPGAAPVYCSSSLVPRTTTICNGAFVVLTITDGPASGVDIVWTSDEGVLAYSENKAVFTAPSAGSGTARIRVRWPGPCDLTSYVAYEHCDGGPAGPDGGGAPDGPEADATETGTDTAPDAAGPDVGDQLDGQQAEGADGSDDAGTDAPDAD